MTIGIFGISETCYLTAFRNKSYFYLTIGTEEFPDLESYIRVALDAFLNSRLLPKMAAPPL